MSARSSDNRAPSLPKQRAGTWLRVSEDESVIVHQDKSSLHVVNETALALWELCNGENTVDEMVTAICELCGESADIVRRDVESTLASFDNAGLIEWSTTNTTQLHDWG